ncbi:12108_t:CDS:1 [Funneliformis caledonium]|uniref:12108_t:CDS:1 n=1 Tax=Funneliformis caledonium TaxID=1117310 RepID=A0A9N8VMN3_9GLOM|nr:12108_t:CDS:1 [Funneliformis caledonium]
MFYVYVLKCIDNKYYVGSTADLNVRNRQHLNGSGSAWTRKYPPICIEWSGKTNNENLETIKTLEYMIQYGIYNVRGGDYCKFDLSIDFAEILYKLICKCPRCDRPGHFDNECACDVCGNRGHLTDECLHCTNCGKRGHSEVDCYNCYKCGRPGHSPDNCDACYLCGERGHFSNDCGYVFP